MTIRLETDPSRGEPEVIIRADRKTKLIENIISAIERCAEEEYPPVTAYRGDTLVLLSQWEIVRIYTENRKLVIHTENGVCEARGTLKELEGTLDPESFVRISRYEIVNLRKVSGFDFSNAGTIRVTLTDRSSTWVARRFVTSIQRALNGRSQGKEETP